MRATVLPECRIRSAKLKTESYTYASPARPIVSYALVAAFKCSIGAAPRAALKNRLVSFLLLNHSVLSFTKVKYKTKKRRRRNTNNMESTSHKNIICLWRKPRVIGGNLDLNCVLWNPTHSGRRYLWRVKKVFWKMPARCLAVCLKRCTGNNL